MNRCLRAGLFLFAVLAATRGYASAQERPADDRSSPATVATTGFAHHGAKAPADEYFGRLKMSILGVRNTIADIESRSDWSAEDVAHNLCHKLTLAEEALRDWQAKYPDDAWIPRLGYAMLKDYEKIDTIVVSEEFRDASIHAIDLASWLEATFPGSEFAPK